MQKILGISCGLDVHKDIIEGCILEVNGTGEPDAKYETFTTMRGDIMRLREWLVEHGCPNVAMESTGVYWKPIYEILEDAEGINLCLVNAQHMHNVPGRKRDKDDAEWISSLYMCGLLNKSFVPEKGIRSLQEHTRYYVKLTQENTRLVNRIEKLLQTHGFKLSSVLSSIVGVSGRRILKLLCEQGTVSVADVGNALARGVKKSAEEIAYAVNGKLTQSSQNLLRIMLDGLNACDEQLAAVRHSIQCVAEPYARGVTILSTIPGLDELSASYLIGEIGVDMSRFNKGASSLCKWAGLSPRDDESAGKIKSNKILKGNPYVKSILCQCAWAATKTRNTRLSNWYWRNVKRLGEKKAIIAVARKLLVYAFHMLSTGELYDKRLDVADTKKLKIIKLASAKQQIKMLEKTLSNESLVTNT